MGGGGFVGMGEGKEEFEVVMTGGTGGEGEIVGVGEEVDVGEVMAGGGAPVEGTLLVVLTADDGAPAFLAAAAEYDGAPEDGWEVEECGTPAARSRACPASLSSSSLFCRCFNCSSCPS